MRSAGTAKLCLNKIITRWATVIYFSLSQLHSQTDSFLTHFWEAFFLCGNWSPKSTTTFGLPTILSKLGQNLSEMEARTFVRIQRVIWEHLLVFRLKLSRSKIYFSFHAEQLAKNNNYELELIMQSALFFLSFSFLAWQGHFLV